MLAFHTAPTSAAGFGAVRLPAGTYRRRQLVAGLLLATLAFLAVVLTARLLAGGDAAALDVAPVARVQVVVEAGDTVWTIAEALAPGEDVRPVVDAIVEANGGANLVPGQRLDVNLP